MILPPATSAMLLRPPAATAIASVRLDTATGTSLSSNVPSPRAPSSLPPHAATPPELCSARLCCSPAATAVASLRLFTETGDLAQASCSSPTVHLLGPVLLPLPSCPKPL